MKVLFSAISSPWNLGIIADDRCTSVPIGSPASVNSFNHSTNSTRNRLISLKFVFPSTQSPKGNKYITANHGNTHISVRLERPNSHTKQQNRATRKQKEKVKFDDVHFISETDVHLRIMQHRFRTRHHMTVFRTTSVSSSVPRESLTAAAPPHARMHPVPATGKPPHSRWMSYRRRTPAAQRPDALEST